MMSSDRCSPARRVYPTKLTSNPNQDHAMTPRCRRKVPQLIDVLRQMQGQGPSTATQFSRKSLKYLKSLVIHPSYSFSSIAHFSDSKPLQYERNSIYTKNLNMAYSVGAYFVKRRPFLSAPFSYLNFDCLLVHLSANICKMCGTTRCSKCRPTLVILSIANLETKLQLLYYDARDGYHSYTNLAASSCHKSAGLTWNVIDETACVTMFIKDEKIFKFFVISVFPIKYEGSICIQKDIKGRGVIKRVSLSLDMLILHEGRHTVTLYGMEYYMRNLHLDPVINDIDDLPPPLISVRNCDGFDMQIGGFPYSLLIAKIGGGYNVQSLKTGEQIGVLDPLEANSIEEDTVTFDETESGLIMQKGEHEIRMFKIPATASPYQNLKPEYPPIVFKSPTPAPAPTTSLFGRTLVRLHDDNYNATLPTILCDPDFEDELDLLYTLTCDHFASPPILYLNILDCHTLEVLKTAALDFDMPQKGYHGQYETVFPMSVTADRDLLIVTWTMFSKNHMRVYQLCHKDSPSLLLDDENIDSRRDPWSDYRQRL